MAQERRKSMDEPIDFKNFLPEYEEREPRMRRIIHELEQICYETKNRKKGVGWKAALAGGAGAAALCVATGGLGLFVAGAGAAAAVGVLAHDKITDTVTLDDVKMLVEEFCGIAQHLIDVQKKRRQMLNKLNKNTDEVFVSLLDSLRNLFFIFTKDSTVERLLEVTDKCRKILEQLKASVK